MTAGFASVASLAITTALVAVSCASYTFQSDEPADAGASPRRTASSSSSDPSPPTQPTLPTLPSQLTDAGAASGKLTCTDAKGEVNPGEPGNDSATGAYPLVATGACDVNATVTGIAEGQADVDWFEFFGRDDDAVCEDDPTVTVAAGQNVTVCATVLCSSSDGTQVTEPSSIGCNTGTPSKSFCCAASTTATISMSFECGGNPKNAFTYFYVTTPVNLCVDYALTYHF